MTALAVALAIGRVVPELGDEPTRWPYTVLGAAFAIYGVGLLLYGSHRARQIDRVITDRVLELPAGRGLALLTWTGTGLGLATLALILFG